MNKLWLIIRFMRIPESLSKVLAVYSGCLFVCPQRIWNDLKTLTIISLLSAITSIVVFANNAILSFEEDKLNSRFTYNNVLNRKRLYFYIMFLNALSIYLISFAPVSVSFLLWGLIVIWFLYSIPKVGLKYLPFGGVLVAALTQIMIFYVGYLPFQVVGSSDINFAGAIYFSLLVAVGHLLHEKKDYMADKLNGIDTTMVFLGTNSGNILVKSLISLTVLISIYKTFYADISWLLLCLGSCTAFAWNTWGAEKPNWRAVVLFLFCLLGIAFISLRISSCV